MKILPLLLLLGGCALTSDKLLLEAQECGIGPECEGEWTKWNDYENWQMDKERREEAWEAALWCPGGYVFVCQDDWCSAKKQKWRDPNPRGFMSGCMNRGVLRDGLRY